MTGMEGLYLPLVLWAGLVAMFVLSGFLTGEWVAKYRDLRDWIRTRRGDGHGTDWHVPGARPHAS